MLPGDRLFFVASAEPTRATKSELVPLNDLPLVTVKLPPLVA